MWRPRAPTKKTPWTVRPEMTPEKPSGDRRCRIFFQSVSKIRYCKGPRRRAARTMKNLCGPPQRDVGVAVGLNPPLLQPKSAKFSLAITVTVFLALPPPSSSYYSLPASSLLPRPCSSYPRRGGNCVTTDVRCVQPSRFALAAPAKRPRNLLSSKNQGRAGVGVCFPFLK